MIEEKTIDVTWSFRYFRRHVPGEMFGVITYLASHHPELLESFRELVLSAKQDLCCRKCLACSRHVFGLQALGGMVVIEPDKTFADNIADMNLLGPLCVSCAKGDMDILRTRCLHGMLKDVFRDVKTEIIGEVLSEPGALR